MAKPVMMTVDDEPQVLGAIERDLRAHYHKDYRIIKAASGAEALQTVHELKRRNAAVALFLVDQRMPGMSGTEFLEKAIQLYPDARKVLLTAYADTDAAISSINRIGLDHYLMKPWDPPEEHLYPVLDDLLSDWLGSVPVPYDGIRVAGTQWSASCHIVKDFLARNQIPYQWLDIERDEQAKALVDSVGDEGIQLPVVFFPDGTVLTNPDPTSLAEKVGLHTRAERPFYDLIIVGAGPAGLAAAVYGASEGLRTVVIEKEATGGQAGTSARIENYLGFPQGISGVDLARRATAQAKRLGAEILTAQEVSGVRVEDPYRFVTLRDGTELSCHSLLIATGMTVRRPDVTGIDAFVGGSIYYGAAITEAKHYQDKQVFVIGGANSAGQGAVFLSQFARQVTILKRGKSLKESMSQYLIDQIGNTPNIDVLTQTEMAAVHGLDRLEALTVHHRATDRSEKMPADAIFIFIGAVPHSGIVADVVELSDEGFILTGPDLLRKGRRPKNWKLQRDPHLMETSVPGIFAAGDVRYNVIRRVASAVGQGAVAVSFVHKYLETV
jgi:thioredoxin reductase (NADPH)